MYKGEVYSISLGNEGIGSEQKGDRYAVVIQNNTGNYYSPTTIVALITSKMCKAQLPTHIEINKTNSGIMQPSIIMCEQVRTVDKSRLGEKIGVLNYQKHQELNKALCISLDLNYIDNFEEEIA